LSAFIIKALSASMTNKNNIGDRGERSNLDRKKWRYGEGTVGGARERSMHSVGREVTERERRDGGGGGGGVLNSFCPPYLYNGTMFIGPNVQKMCLIVKTSC
jgi:hypothetical protein